MSKDDVGEMFKATVVIFLFAMVLFMLYDSVFSCSEHKQKHAWMAFDSTMVHAPDSNYAIVSLRAIKEREEALESCDCPQERPSLSMDPEEIERNKTIRKSWMAVTLVETAVSYDKCSRCIDESGASFYASVDRKCRNSVGRLMILDSLQPKGNGHIMQVLKKHGPSVLQEKYRILASDDGPQFLFALEILHADPDNWGARGLSANGIEEVKKIIDCHGLDGDDILEAIAVAEQKQTK